jgi:hypothetical protein
MMQHWPFLAQGKRPIEEVLVNAVGFGCAVKCFAH